MGGPVYAVLGRVKIKPGQDFLIRSMVAENGREMVRGISGAKQATWFRIAEDDQVQQALWLFENLDDARRANVTFEALRDMPDAPSEFVSSDVCEVIGHAATENAPRSRGPVMTRWEYAWVHETSTANPNKAMQKVVDAASKWGEQGWEMVNITSFLDNETGLTMVKRWHVTAAFKRPKVG
jgi:hypothetical protein